MFNIEKFLKELTQQPNNPTVSTCPVKNPSSFDHLEDSDYLYALYRYKSLGTICKEN